MVRFAYCTEGDPPCYTCDVTVDISVRRCSRLLLERLAEPVEPVENSLAGDGTTALYFGDDNGTRNSGGQIGKGRQQSRKLTLIRRIS